MKRRGKSITIAAALLTLGVVAGAGYAARDWAMEWWELRKLESGSCRERAQALARLVERGSMRGIGHLALLALESGREAMLEATLAAMRGRATPAGQYAPYYGTGDLQRPRYFWALTSIAGTPIVASTQEWVFPPIEASPFAGIGEEALRFIRAPLLRDAVQFGCVRSLAPQEDALTEALEKGPPPLQLQALAVLLRVRAPRSVHLQWSVLQGLKRSSLRREWDMALKEMEALFAPEAVTKAIQAEPPAKGFQWNVRAAGVTRLREAVPRLKALSVSLDPCVAHAAERSLEDIPGPETDEALAHCVGSWRYDSFLRAAEALLVRNKPLLHRTLLSARPPPDHRYWQGMLLARCDDPGAVPILCAEVADMAIVDGEMLEHIARLAGPEHRRMVEALSRNVREEQAELARRTMEQYRQRLLESAADSGSGL